MPQIVKCPGCGKPLWIADPGSGVTTTCSGCGTGVQASPAPPLGAAALGTPQAAGAPSRGGAVVLWVSVAALVTLTAAGTWYGLTRYGPSSQPQQASSQPGASAPVAPPVAPADAWEAENRPKILAAKAEADDLAAKGELRPSMERYREVQQMVGEHRPAAADLRRAIADAKAAEDRVVDLLLHGTAPVANSSTDPDPLKMMANPGAPATTAPATRTAVAVITPPATPPAPVVPVAPPPPAARAGAIARKAQPKPVADLTDEEVGRAIERGVDRLLRQFENGHLRGRALDESYGVGMNSLAMYALFQASLAVKDERLNPKGPLVKSMLAWLKAAKIEGGVDTYSHALRATALSVFNRPEDKQALASEVNWLIKASHKGGYGYSLAGNADDWDNSNSQYGLLGVWAGAEAGIVVPDTYWQTVENHWRDCQTPDGQWSYRSGAEMGTYSMNCAGIASMFVTHDYLDATKVGANLGRPAFSKPLEKAMAWMEQGDNSVKLDSGAPPWFAGYNLYGLERVGLASGMKHFGSHDWYRELARTLVSAQQPDGTWHGVAQAMRLNAPDEPLYDQCYVLLFLSRGRHPVLFSKLRFDGPWSNRPRDTANLARYASRELEKPINWQIVGTQRGWTDWMDSPILYLAGHTAPKLADSDIENFRAFVHAGGLIYLNSDGGSEAFTKFAAELGKKLFPAYEMAVIPQDHPLYSMVMPMTNHPPVRAVSNGARLLMVNTTTDPAASWQQRAEKARPEAFQLGLNLFVYASGKADFRNRLTSPVLPAPSTPPSHTVAMAQLKYNGNWDPEPGALPRMSRYLWQQTGWGLDLKTIDLASLTPGSAPIAHLTGTFSYTPTPAETKAIKDYVEAGGVLIIDAAGGSSAFAQSLEIYLLPQAFPSQKPQVMDATHPLLNGRGEGYTELAHPRIRIGQGVPPSPTGARIFSAGKGHVLYSPLDITSGLLGTSTAGITGFRSEYALPLMKNIVLWTEDGQPDR